MTVSVDTGSSCIGDLGVCGCVCVWLFVCLCVVACLFVCVKKQSEFLQHIWRFKTAKLLLNSDEHLASSADPVAHPPLAVCSCVCRLVFAAYPVTRSLIDDRVNGYGVVLYSRILWAAYPLTRSLIDDRVRGYWVLLYW